MRDSHSQVEQRSVGGESKATHGTQETTETTDFDGAFPDLSDDEEGPEWKPVLDTSKLTLTLTLIRTPTL